MIVKIGNTGFERRRREYTYDDGSVMLSLGDGSYIDEATLHLGDSKCCILVGKYTSIGRDVKFIIGLNHDYRKISSYPFTTIRHLENGITDVNPNDCIYNKRQVVIGSDVWIGTGVTIMGGVHIGHGAIIGAGTVVAKDIPPYAVVVGNPAQIKKFRFSKEKIKFLLDFKWWNNDEAWINENEKNITSDSFEGFYDYEIKKRVKIKELDKLKEDGYKIFYMIPDLVDNGIWFDYIKYFTHTYESCKVILIVANKMDKGDNGWFDELLERINYNKMVKLYEFARREDLIPYIDAYIQTKVNYSAEFIDMLKNINIVHYVPDEMKKYKRPILTIGIPTYNRLKCLKKSIMYICDAVGNNDDVEIFISDNNSNDNTRNYMKKICLQYKNVKYVCQEKNIGGAKNFDFLWMNSRGEYVWLWGDDDYFHPNVIEAVKRVLHNRDVSILALLNLNQNNYFDFKYIKDKGIDSYIKNVTYISTAISSFVIKTDLLKMDEFIKMKYFNETLRSSLLSQVPLQFEVLNRNDNYAMLIGKLYLPGNGENLFITPEEYKKIGRESGWADLGEIFIHQFFDILNDYKKYGITDDTIKICKKIVLDKHIIPYSNLANKQLIKWNAKDVIKWYDIYYSGEEYYKESRIVLEKILADLDFTLKTNNSDL